MLGGAEWGIQKPCSRSSAAGTNWPASSQKYGRRSAQRWLRKTTRENTAKKMRYEPRRMERRPAVRGPAAGLLYAATGGLRLQLDLAERVFVLGDVLLQDVE